MMFRDEQPLQHWEQKIISRAGRLPARPGPESGKVSDPGMLTVSLRPRASRQNPNLRAPATLEDRLVTLFAD